MTTKRAAIVRTLREGAAKYLMIRPMSSVPVQRRNELLSGTKLVVIVDGEAEEPEGVPEASGMAARGLIESGYLAEVEEPTLQWGHLYALTESGNKLDFLNVIAGREGWDSDLGPRVFRRDLNQIAGEFGCTVDFDSTRRWWELVIPNNGRRKRRVMLTTPRNQPIARLSDLSLTDWSEVISRVAGQHGLTRSTE